MINLSIGTLNVWGLGNNEKRRQIFTWLRDKNLNIYLLQETKSTADKENIWALEWGYCTIFNGNNRAAHGVCILFNNNFQFEIKNIRKDFLGRYIIAHLLIEKEDLVLVNVYGPNADDYISYENFFNELDDFTQFPVVMGGDLNICLTELDKQGGRPFYYSHNLARNTLIENMDRLDIVDIWRNMNPNLKQYTWRQRSINVSCRLDYFLTSVCIANSAKTVEILPGYRTDHSFVKITFSKDAQNRGPGFFKLNTSLLLQKGYVDKIKALISQKKEEYKNQNVNPNLLWETIKSDIRGETIKYSILKKKERGKRVKNIEKELDILEKVNDIYRNDITENRILRLKEELQDIYAERVNGILTRAKVRWLKEGEKNTKYFIGLEKRNYINKTIIQLIDNEGKTLSNQNAILKEEKQFYEKLYSENSVNLDDEELLKTFFVDSTEVNKLDNEMKNKCDGPITKEECQQAIKSLSNCKSPGTDGLPAEFYKIFWNEISDLLVESFNFSFIKKELSISQKQGIITLLPKTDRDIRYLKNWRPISLLNTDYKILTKCIADRLKLVLPFLIHPNQTGFLQNRYIGSNIRLLLDLIEYTQEQNQPGMIFAIDFEKAFDTVNWKFLLKCLDYFNFGESFKSWIQIIQNGSCSCIVNNGWSSQMFNLNQGVRQGCPLSPYLFLLCSEIFGISVRHNQNIKGIKLVDFYTKLIHFADDTQMLLDGSQESLDAIIELLKKFEQISGLKINFDKSEIVKLGKSKETDYMLSKEIKITQDFLKVLGIKIPVSGNLQDITSLNFQPILSKIKSVTKSWNKRNLTLYGKGTIIKSLVLPQIIYQLTNLPSPPTNVLKEIDDIMFDFIWSNKRPKIKRAQLYEDFSQGGLKIPNIFAYSQSLKLRWIRALADGEDVSDWKKLFYARYPRVAKFIVHGNVALKDVKQLGIRNEFWMESLKTWLNIHYNNCTVMNFRGRNPSTMIWFNSNIKINSKIMFNAEWYHKGILHIKDLLDEETGHFLSFNAFFRKYNLSNFTLFYGIVNTIRKNYQNQGREIDEDLKVNKLIQSKSVSKTFYQEILRGLNKHTRRKCFQNWENKLGKVMDWEEIFSNIYIYTVDTKLRHFQFKLIHDIFPDNKLLKKLGILDSDRCDFCHTSVDSVGHYLWECEIVQTFWNDFGKWLENNFGPIRLSFENIIFWNNFIRENFHNSCINFLILLAKYHVHCCKWLKTLPSLRTLEQVIKQREKIERQIAFDLHKLDKHNKKWSKLKETLQL